MDKQILTIAGAAVGGAAVGSVITYFSVKARLAKKYRDDLEILRNQYALRRKEPEAVKEALGYNPIDETLDDRSFTYDDGEYVFRDATGFEVKTRNPDEIFSMETATEDQKREAAAFLEHLNIMTRAQYISTEEPEPENEVTEDDTIPAGNIWENNSRDNMIDDTMAEYEIIDGEPYILTLEEFQDRNSTENTTDTLVYFEGDDTLVDSDKSPIDNIDYVIGERHLEMWGLGSKQKDILYIRNNHIGIDYEVVRDRGEYTVQVLRLEPEMLGLREPKQRPLKMRDHD